MNTVQPEGAMTALTIRLQDELFAVEASRVREILDLVPITEVPNAPSFVGGLINVRGRVVPLADLRVMFGMERPEPDEDTRIVVMEVDIDGEPTIAGILADKVHDVTDIEAASIEEAPKVGMRWRPEFVKGIGKRNGGFIIIPDMEKIFETPAGRSPSVAASEERSAS
jgi:purine-binding chemotaxis protein CheW